MKVFTWKLPAARVKGEFPGPSERVFAFTHDP